MFIARGSGQGWPKHFGGDCGQASPGLELGGKTLTRLKGLQLKTFAGQGNVLTKPESEEVGFAVAPCRNLFG